MGVRMEAKERKYLTIREVASMLGYRRATIVACLKKGAPYIAPRKFGLGTARGVRIDGDEFIKWMQADLQRASESFRRAKKPTWKRD